MKMKENPNIDELLNSFIDGELTARQRTEVQRLIAHDARIAQRLAELEKCKMLVGSLPCAEAPAGMAEEIKASLERGTLFGLQPRHIDERAGARHLLARKVLTAAAMISLVAILGVVIYTIVGPERAPDKPVAVEGWEAPSRKFELDQPVPRVVATAEKPTVGAGLATMGFNGRVELKTNILVAVDAFIKRAIEDSGLLEYSPLSSQVDKSVYALSGSRETLSLLLVDLENIWERFDSATLFVETDQLDGEVVVEAVTTEQIAEIVNQDNLKNRIKVAKDFAILNNTAKLLRGREILAAINDEGEDLITIPKPVLTSSKKAIKRPASRVEDVEKVHLTIVIVGSE